MRTANVNVINDTVSASFIAMETNLCDTLNIAFTNNSSSGNYYWDFGDGSNSSMQNPTHAYTASGVYDISLIVTDSSTCNVNDTFSSQITFTALQELQVNIGDYYGCAPLAIQFQNGGTPAQTYYWDFGDGSNSSLTSPSNIYTQPGQYSVMLVATDSNTCNVKDTAINTVNVLANPVADFDYQPEYPTPGESVSFTNLSSNATTYSWNFGDGGSSTDEDPVHAYLDSGTYIICLGAISSDDCFDSVCKALDLSSIFVVDVPNAFTPNGDNQNDVLYVRGQGVKEIDFRIYNRWGELVFESSEMNKGWDGTYKGEPQEMEAYGYYLRAVFRNNKVTEKKGNVTLMR